MWDDFEERLRRALDARAGEITPDPNLWRRVEASIDRDRRFRFALSGVTIAAVAAFAVVAARPLMTRTQIALVEGGSRPATQPAPTTAVAPEGMAAAPQVTQSSPARYCSNVGGVAAVLATASGDLAAVCVAGGIEALTKGAEIDAHPAIDGSIVSFDRYDSGDQVSQLMELDLVSGKLSSGEAGQWPAFGPDGKFAYIVDVHRDGRQPEIVVREGLHGPILTRFSIFKEGAEELSARHLSFDAAGDRIFWEAGYEGSAVWISALDKPEPTRLDSTTNQDAVLAAPTSRAPRTLTAISRCCVMTEGDRPTAAKLVTQNQHGTIAELADLTKLDGFDVASTELFLAPAGQATLKDGRWQLADQPAWLIGDGQRVFLVGSNGKAAPVSDHATSGAFNASPALAGASSPTPRLVTVQVYLPRDEETDCKTTFALPRRVTAPAVLRGALTQLLAGPTQEERAQGYGGLFSSATEGYLRDVRLDVDGVAYVDFRDLRQVIPNASSSCASSVLLSQLDATARQFPNVKAVRYSINSDEAAFYEWLQRSPPS